MKSNFRRINELFVEFSRKLEEQHTYYLDSVVGYSKIDDVISSKQEKIIDILGKEHELANKGFLDTCSTVYKEIGKQNYTSVSLSPVMKQGDVKARNVVNGTNTLLLGSNCIVALYGYWEEYLRIELGIAKGIIPQGSTNTDEVRRELNKHVVSDIWGDLRHLRHSIVHSNGWAYSKIEKCKIITCFKENDYIILDFSKMQAIFLLLAEYRNELYKMSIPPRKGVRLPG